MIATESGGGGNRTPTTVENVRVHPLDEAEYLLVTTFRRDGSPVPTPVWFAGSGGRFVFVTGAESGKVKRLRTLARVEIAVCDRKGDVLAGAAILGATARELAGDDAATAAAQVRAKYGVKWKAFEAGSGIRSRIRSVDRAAEVSIEVLLTEAI